jgi:hypothetical protein
VRIARKITRGEIRVENCGELKLYTIDGSYDAKPVLMENTRTTIKGKPVLMENTRMTIKGKPVLMENTRMTIKGMN